MGESEVGIQMVEVRDNVGKVQQSRGCAENWLFPVVGAGLRSEVRS